jgi:hypothetical protein
MDWQKDIADSVFSMYILNKLMMMKTDLNQLRIMIIIGAN